MTVDPPLLAQPWPSAAPWFDRDWYPRRNPDVAKAGIDPLVHYLRYGEAEGRFPCAWFDPIWYRTAYDIPIDRSPLEHFLTHRDSLDLLPHPALWAVTHLDPWRATNDPLTRFLDDHAGIEREILPDLTVIGSAGLMDPRYHRLNGTSRAEALLDPALHYCRFGARLGLRPNNAFDVAWYTGNNPAVSRLGINPLTHYILAGEAAHRRPIPWFDPLWYRDTHAVPGHELALAHYLTHRLARAVSPNPFFDPAWYVDRHGHRIPEDIDPFSHYLVTGALSDIDPSPRFDAGGWRHRHMAPLAAQGQRGLPVTARNPLVHFLTHRAQEPEGAATAGPA